MIKKILNYTLLFICFFTILTHDVKALNGAYDLGYYPVENRVNVGSFLWSNGSFPLYAYQGDGSYTPLLSTFYSGNYSLFYYDGSFDLNNTRGNYALSFNLTKALESGKTYEGSLKLEGSSLDYYFNGVSEIANADLNSTTLTCTSTTTCILNFSMTMNSTTNTLYLNINLGVGGLNGYYFNELVTGLYFPQIKTVSEFDSTIIENNQNIIIDQNQTIIDQNNQLNDNITSEEAPDTSDLSDVAGWLPPGPVDSLITLPLSLFNSISRDLSSSCSPVTLPLPYVNKDLTLPCMSTFYDGIGIGSFMDWIGVIASGFILFSYLMKLYKWVDDTLTFRENNHLDNWGGV